jgi:RNA polymerase sigma-70 factor (ECF subfamily)
MFINLLNAVLTGAIPKTISDEDAISNYLRTQNVNYFNLLYDRYSRKVYSKCFSILRDEMKAEDAVQDIFMKILSSLSKFEAKAKFSTWLYTITYNFCIDVIRREKKDITHEVEDIGRLGEEVEDDIEDAELMEVELDKLKVVLSNLGVDDKSVLLMKYQDDLSIKDMCEVLNKSESAIKMQIKRAKERFLRVYKQMYS